MTDVWIIASIVVFLAGVYLVTQALVRRKTRSHQEVRQDVLKQSYHLHEKKKEVTLESLAGALHVERDIIAGVVSELTDDGLIESSGERIRLTGEGTTTALKLIRSHRLWERYLADETGVQETRWHDEADKQEHKLTPDEANALAKRLGHPVYDPHGDPIPQKDLDLPRPKGQSLSSATPGGDFVVIHMEDEPVSVYNELVGHGILRGSRIRLLSKDQAHAEIECDGNPVRIPLVSAANITVTPTREQVPVQRTGRTLGDLGIGEEGKVVSLSPACRGMQRRRLLDLGVLPGTVIRAEMQSPLGDPTGYRIRGSLVALRRREADFVNVEVS